MEEISVSRKGRKSTKERKSKQNWNKTLQKAQTEALSFPPLRHDPSSGDDVDDGRSTLTGR